MTSLSRRPGVLPARGAAVAAPVSWTLADLRGTAAAATASAPAGEAAEARWRQEVEEAYARGVRDGRAAGEAEGRRQEAERLAHAVHAAEAAAAAIRAGEEPWLDALEENVQALAVAVARHVIGRELRSDARAVADLVRRALAEFHVDQEVRVRLNPHDLSMISAAAAPGTEPIPIAPGRNLRWQPDPTIEPGGCIVEGRERIVDGRVDRALERIYYALRDA